MTITMKRTQPRSAARRAAPWLAGAWALAFGALSGLALLGRIPAPWVPTDASPLSGLSGAQMSGAVGVAALLALAAGAVGVATQDRRTRRRTGRLLIVVGLVVALVVSDVRALMFLGYLPQILLALVGTGPGAGQLGWDIVLDAGAGLAHAVGGLATVVAGIGLLERAEPSGRLDWGRWARWGRPAVAVAAVVPLLYAVTRIAWAVGVPLGIRREMLDELGEGRWAGLGLALFAVVGSALTCGLIARWGEVFWRWVPRVGGREVPVAMALMPGLLVAGAVTSAGLSFWRMIVGGDLASVPGATEDWAAWAPETLWPLWGVALAVACLAYLGRRTSADPREISAKSAKSIR
ncbi:hypothetical protein J2S40_004690 [Nocardioides luteus]|uniref:DUF998 domain-containing protein n=1 Tax=Nocardioides luteus TaxID=1844 RepID=A0ABQ5T321_9ACTN|nr:hypothetical protein [Nocardioides luteus]MDR7313632.1 hypothetical protein [Nocardioides luteus]GGR64372.1 hypothetical protein GCM10010197_34870 [Nocardioides luteus]GLJ70521.1 hypothetical protein GCM10017579_45570 [Nocardioides luteus]